MIVSVLFALIQVILHSCYSVMPLITKEKDHYWLLSLSVSLGINTQVGG